MESKRSRERRTGSDVLVHKDCFAYQPGSGIYNGESKNECRVCGVLECKYGPCHFYKSAARENEELLRTHGTNNLDAILKQYFNARVSTAEEKETEKKETEKKETEGKEAEGKA